MKINIESQEFITLEVYKCDYFFDRNNSGPVRCRDCKGEIAPGLGIHRQAYKRNGYLCFACFAKDVTILTTRFDGKDGGFFIDSLGRLRACTLNSPSISSPEVIEAVFRAMLDESYTSVDILIGEETAHPFKIADTAEAMIGANIQKGG
jgi:hypothetical protein